MNLRNIFRSIKPFLGKMEVEIDRHRQIIYFKRNGKTEIMTIDQLYDEIESIFTKARPTAPITLDPFGGGTIDRISPPGGSWLSNYDKPRSIPWEITTRPSESRKGPWQLHSRKIAGKTE